MLLNYMASYQSKNGKLEVENPSLKLVRTRIYLYDQRPILLLLDLMYKIGTITALSAYRKLTLKCFTQ